MYYKLSNKLLISVLFSFILLSSVLNAAGGSCGDPNSLSFASNEIHKYNEKLSSKYTTSPKRYQRYYKFTAPANGTINISTENFDEDSDAILYDNSCSTNLGQDTTGSNNITINATVTAGTTYKLKIYYNRNKDDKYNLHIIFTPSGGGGGGGGVPAVCTAPTGNQEAFRDFCRRYNVFVPGDMLSIGNTFTVAPFNDNSTANCTAYTNEPFFDPISSNNSKRRYCHYNIDGSRTQGAATSAELPIPAGSTIRWAGLYWQAIAAHPVSMGSLTIDIRNNASGTGYHRANATRVDYAADFTTNIAPVGLSAGASSADIYSAFADVTALFQTENWLDGNYTVRSLDVLEGQQGSFGVFAAWNLIVIYENQNESLKSFTIFDGWKSISSSNRDEEIDVSGFYTSKTTPINARVSVFAGEGDYNINNDILTALRQSDGTTVQFLNSNNPSRTNQTFSSRVFIDGSTHTPTQQNNNGIDVQIFDIGSGTSYDLLSTEQTSMEFHFTSTGDLYFPSVIAFATDIYEPKFCFDYGYKQNGLTFTEENNGTELPRIEGFVTDNADINVSIYIKNLEDSDVSAINVDMNITDINTTQAIYSRNSTYVTYPTNYTPTTNTDAGWPLIVGDSFIKKIPISKRPLPNEIGSKEFIYLNYALTPQQTGDINMSINATFSYDLQITLPDASVITIPYTSTIGGPKLPMCTAANFSFNPEWGIYSMVEPNYFSSSFFNLTTQTAQRAGNYSLASFDTSGATETPRITTDMVKVELIDAGVFHDVNASCADPSSAISDSANLWILNASNTAITAGPTGNLLDPSGNHITQTQYNNFFKQANMNTAWRVWFLTDPRDATKLTLSCSGGNWNLETDSDLNTWTDDPTGMNCSTQCDAAASTDFCGAALGTLPGSNATECLSCLYQKAGYPLCSRDNFSVRPESFNISLSDVNQSNFAQRQRFALNRTGTNAPVQTEVDLAAGYNYHYDINATSHISNDSVPGYTRYFGGNNAEYNATLIFQNKTALAPFCNDITDTPQTFNMISGVVSQEGNHTQVGNYFLNFIDTTWTQVDNDPLYMQHHANSNFYRSGGVILSDCRDDSSQVPNWGINVALGTVNNTTIVGCDINSTHDNTEASLKYLDYNLTFHPYKFDISNLIPSRGFTLDINFTYNVALQNPPFVYMNNIADANVSDDNMSLQIIGNIIPRGADNGTLSNFTDQCFAQPLSIDLNRTLSNTTANIGTNFRYSLLDFNLTNFPINPMVTAITNSLDTTIIPVVTSSFTKSQQGSSNLQLRLNFDRPDNIELNPANIILNDLNVSCTNLADCQSQADFNANFDINGTLDYNLTTVTFVYASVYAPPYTVLVDEMNATISYNVYCSTVGANGCLEANYPDFNATVAAPNTLSHYYNTSHNDLRDGRILLLDQNTTLGIFVTHDTVETPIARASTNGTVIHNIEYNGANGHSYTATMNIWSPLFLQFSPVAPLPRPTNFKIRFLGAGQWSGVNSKGASSSNTDSGINTNRRINW